jgi:hypothetical protein
MPTLYGYILVIGNMSSLSGSAMYFDVLSNNIYILSWESNTLYPWVNIKITPTWYSASLLSGWTNFNQGYGTAQYSFDGNTVRMRGLILNETISSAICSLPVGMRPPYNLMFRCACANGAINVLVQSNGDVVPTAEYTGNPRNWLSLANISYSVSL